MECPRPLYADSGPFGSKKSDACVTRRAQSGSSCSSKVNGGHISIDQKRWQDLPCVDTVTWTKFCHTVSNLDIGMTETGLC